MGPLPQQCLRRAGQFRHSAGGNVTLFACVGMLALIGCAGAAIDYVRLNREETILSAAADAAALAAVSSAKTSEENGKSGAVESGVKAGEQAWAVNIAESAVSAGTKPTISVTRDSGGWTARVTYDAKAATSFMSVLGVKSMRLAGSSKASGGGTSKAAEFWDLHLVVDNSNSMNLGATPADMAGMRTNFNCEFACHTPPNPFASGPSLTAMMGGTPDDAHYAGFRLRIDVVMDAVDSLMTAIGSWSNGNKVRVQLWGLNNTVDSLVGLTGKLKDVSDAAIVTPVESTSIGDTDFAAAMAKLDTEVGKSGSGSSPVDPRKAVFIVTDGMHDSRTKTSNWVSTWNSNHFIGTMDPAFCQVLKDKGVTIGVLYIDYYTPSGYTYVTNPVINDLKPQLQACASAGLFYNATTPEGITAALNDMIGTAVTNSGNAAVRLVN